MAAVQHRASAGGSTAVRRSALLLLLSGLTFAAAETPAVLAQVPSTVGAASAHPHAANITEASRRFGVPAAWIVAVMAAESAGDVRAVSSAGAMGLMQLMPDTWAELRTRHGLGRDPYDPRDNILAGTAYLREMWDRYGDVAAMLAAYNAGPARYDEHRSKGRPLPAETRAYVASLAPALRASGPERRLHDPATAQLARGGDLRRARGWHFCRQSSAGDRASDDALPSLTATQDSITALQRQELFVAGNAAGGRP